jgi:hypothetical protein
MAPSTGPKVLTEQLVEPATGQAEFLGGLGGANLLVAIIGQEVTN